MLISASIFATKDSIFDYAKQLSSAKVDYLHVDLFDYGDEKLKLEDICLFDENYLPLDIHLIYKELDDSIIDKINNSTATILSVQYENLKNPQKSLEYMRKFRGAIGFAITSKTTVDEISEFIPLLNHILVMCSEPGVSGASFNTLSYNLIDELHSKYPTLKIFADGGVETGVGRIMMRFGVALLVSGSFLASNIESLGISVYRLKHGNEFDIPVTRNMIKIDMLPVVSSFDGFLKIMEIINTFRLGLCFVMKKDKLLGIITDGDLRRACLKYQNNVFDITAVEILNKDFFYVSSDEALDNVYVRLYNLQKPVNVVPVFLNDKFIGATVIN